MEEEKQATLSMLEDTMRDRPDVRVYLEEKVFPILTTGLEELLIAVEERDRLLEEEEDVPEIHPLFFLARYLMKNAPTKSSGNESQIEETSMEKDETNDDDNV